MVHKVQYRSLPLAVGYGLAAVFAAWASYRIHVLPIEQSALPILEAIINLEGRAPDQYRILPYLLIGGLTKLFSLFPIPGPELRFAVLFFDSLFLWLSALLILRIFSRSINHNFVWILFLIYPFLMFDGYRPISSFILFLSTCTIALMRTASKDNKAAYFGFICLIILVSFSRADVALLFALASAGYLRNRVIEKAAIIAIPLTTQILLSEVIFADAEYYSAVIMLWTNLSGEFLIRSPLVYLVLGLFIYYWQEVRRVLSHAKKHQPFAFWAICGYLSALMIFAMPNEFRLFLPLLPLYLWLFEDSRSAARTDVESPSRT